MHYNCLIVDDEEVLAKSTEEYFNLFNVNSFAVFSVKECDEFFKTNTCDLILLDINLKDGSGFSFCKKLRENTNIPILFISARSSDDDKIVALNIGGDDYIEKPYTLGVLLAKVKAVLKRYCTKSNAYKDGRLVINFDTLELFVNNKEVKLTVLEFKLLTYLIKNKDRVISKQELFSNVWEDKFTQDGTLNVHIRRIREAIEVDANNPKYILTVWGEGYRFIGGK